MSVVALVQRGVLPGAGLLARLPVAPDEAAGLLLTLVGLLPAALYVTWVCEDGPVSSGSSGACSFGVYGCGGVWSS